MALREWVTILLIEDDLGHARLIEKNLRRAKISNEIVKIGDGRKALDFLFREGDYRDSVLPSPLLVLLDLNLPIVEGVQVLKRMKENPSTRHIPVIVLTTTDDPREISRCYELGCNVYVTKPVEYEKFAQAIGNLGFFLSIVSVPNGE